MSDAAPAPAASTCPFLVVTPLGLDVAVGLAEALATCGVRVAERRPIHPWSRASTSLYARRDDPGAATRALRLERHWRTLFPEDRAERWQLVGDDDHERLTAHKAILRQRFRSLPLPRCRTDEPQFRLHAFHVPDSADLRAEAQRLDGFGAAD